MLPQSKWGSGGVGQFAVQKFIEDDPQRINVGALVDKLCFARYLLRCCPGTLLAVV